MSLYAKAGKILKQHLVDTTAIVAEVTPIATMSDMFYVGLTQSESVDIRVKAAILSYSGVSFLTARGRDLSRKFFHVYESSSERRQWVHDTAFNMTMNALTTAPIFLSAGASFEETVKGTLFGIGLGLVNGYPVGCAIDTFRDLAGIVPCKRKWYPARLRDASMGVKRAVMIGALALSYCAISSVYSIAEARSPPSTPVGVERVIEGDAQHVSSMPTLEQRLYLR